MFWSLDANKKKRKSLEKGEERKILVCHLPIIKKVEFDLISLYLEIKLNICGFSL